MNSFRIYPDGSAYTILFDRRTSAVFDETTGRWIEGKNVAYDIRRNQALLIRHAGYFLFRRNSPNMMIYEVELV